MLKVTLSDALWQTVFVLNFIFKNCSYYSKVYYKTVTAKSSWIEEVKLRNKFQDGGGANDNKCFYFYFRDYNL